MVKTRKEVNHSYYLRKIKPYRRNKGVAKQLKMRCFMCGHWLDYKKYMEKQPSIRIDIKSWTFGGRASIIVSTYADLDHGSREAIRNMLISKLKLMLGALNEPYIPLERVIAVSKAPVSRERFNISIPEDKIPIKETMEVKIW